jgi:VIT1/CCC1 family predicted Fe2+/Mn2+ transporter
VLSPIDRVSEVLFGLIMVLTFTGSLSIAAGREDVRAMLIGALGCNLAWGIIDGILYVMGALAEESRNLMALRAVRASRDPEEARQLVSDALPPLVASVMQPADVDSLRQRLGALPAPPERVTLNREMYLGGLAVFLWVFVTTFPVAIPFMVIPDAHRALRVSNGVAVALLFVAGFVFGRITNRSPWLTGIAMVVIGLVLVALTMALGG